MLQDFLTAGHPYHQLGYLFLLLGVIALGWTVISHHLGRTSVERAFGRAERIDQDEQPERFARAIRVSLVGCGTMIAIGVGLLLWY